MTYAVFGVVRLYVVQSTWALMLTMFLASTAFPPILELTLIIGECVLMFSRHFCNS